MQLDLTSGTDAGLHLLYDPANVMHLLAAPYDAWHERIVDEAHAANVIAYDTGGDGDAKFRVFVDEMPDQELAGRAVAKKTGHLKVPSGRLFASGMELLDTRGKPPATPGDFQLRSPQMGSCHQIPPGSYDVEAYDLDPESIEEDQALDRVVANARATNPIGFRLAIVHRVLGLGGLLHVITVVAVAILVIFFFSDRAAGWLLLDGKSGIAYRVLAGLWGARLTLGWLPPVRAFLRAIRVEAEKHPHTVVILTRRTAEPDSWAGVVFGAVDPPEVSRARAQRVGSSGPARLAERV